MQRRALAPFAVLPAVLLALAACSGGSVPPEPTRPDPSTALATPAELRLRVGGSVQVRGGTSPLTVTFRDVAGDSRCPIDVQCPWAGDAEIDVQLSRDGRSATATLHTTTEPKQVEYEGFVVRLVSVEPSTRAGVEIPKSEYQVVLRVTR